MSEPTKQEGDEMEDLARQFAKNYSWQFVLPPSALFKLVAHVRAIQIPELERQLSESAKEVERLRAHVQEAADRYSVRIAKFEQLLVYGAKASRTHPHVIERDFHLSALSKKAPVA